MSERAGDRFATAALLRCCPGFDSRRPDLVRLEVQALN
jgi:hypothetical protein